MASGTASNKNYGLRAEQKVAKSLRGHGAKVDPSPGSLGASDLNVRFSSGRKWVVQVKATRKGSAKNPTANEVRRLKNVATRKGATPVIAKVQRGKTAFTSARSGRKVSPPSRSRQ